MTVLVGARRTSSPGRRLALTLAAAAVLGCGDRAPASDGPRPAASSPSASAGSRGADPATEAPAPSPPSEAAGAARPGRPPPRTHAARSATDVALPGQDVAFGLRLPAGAARTVVLADSIDVRVAMPLERVAGHVRAQLAFPLVEETAADGLRYPAARLESDPSAAAITVLLLPMPRGDVLVRVRRLGPSSQTVDPLTARRMNE